MSSRRHGVHVLMVLMAAFLKDLPVVAPGAVPKAAVSSFSNGDVPERAQRLRVGGMSPVVFVPGTGGSQLEARMDPTHTPPPGCPREPGWYRLWLNIMYMVTGDLHCWVDAMRLTYNKTSRSSSNVPGVFTRVPNFGVTDGIEYIDPSWTAWVVGNVGMYAAPLIDKLEEWGYIRNQNVLGAPYDFRFAPHSLSEYFRSLTSLIEDTYRKNGNARVTLLAHSMGGIVALYFLNNQSQAWKDYYIHRFVSMNAPWKGTVVITQALASGFNWGQDDVDPWMIREQQRTQESNTLLLPSPGTWRHNDVIVQTPTRNYTARDLRAEFFDDIGFPIGRDFVGNILGKREYVQRNPGVKMYCLYTHGVPTSETIIYKKGFHIEKQPAEYIKGDGDGTVNYKSLRGCRGLRLHTGRRPRSSVYLRGFRGPSHDGIFTDERAQDLLRNILTYSVRGLS